MIEIYGKLNKSNIQLFTYFYHTVRFTAIYYFNIYIYIYIERERGRLKEKESERNMVSKNCDMLKCTLVKYSLQADLFVALGANINK